MDYNITLKKSATFFVMLYNGLTENRKQMRAYGQIAGKMSDLSVKKQKLLRHRPAGRGKRHGKADKNTRKRLIYPLEPASDAAPGRSRGESGRKKADKNTGKRLIYPLEPASDAAQRRRGGESGRKKQIKTQKSG